MKPATPRRGRPKKYGRPSHPITVTLPEDVLARLRVVDADIGRAIVRLVERQDAPRGRPRAAAALTEYGRHAVIVVTPARALKRLPGVELVPLSDGRALISLDHPNSISEFELGLLDALDAAVTDGDRETLQELVNILRRARKSRRVSIKERSIIVLEAKTPHLERVL